MALYALQHQCQRCGGDESNDRQHPVVGQHHGSDKQHQGPVEQPGETTPLEELGERLDVAGDASDQRSLSLFAVVGDAEAVDVFEETHPQSVQGLLAATAQAEDSGALRPGGE
ncbi:unannotated protein [freshwater metagenome]|uniref:Unannotated protein n=1 Tax=freshwater metagenome TaxID=449393 RepID=A0A6J7C2F4_9ZZZZ